MSCEIFRVYMCGGCVCVSVCAYAEPINSKCRPRLGSDQEGQRDHVRLVQHSTETEYCTPQS